MTMNRPIDSSIEDVMKIHTGEANRERPHLIVPLYMPLGDDLPHDVASRYVSQLVRDRIAKGKCQLVAVAGGYMNDGLPEGAQFVLLYGSLDDEDEPGYWTFETFTGEVEIGVLMNGDGTRCFPQEPLPPKDAIIKWMANFLGWNCEKPGLYDLSYAMVGKEEAGVC